MTGPWKITGTGGVNFWMKKENCWLRFNSPSCCQFLPETTIPLLENHRFPFQRDQ